MRCDYPPLDINPVFPGLGDIIFIIFFFYLGLGDIIFIIFIIIMAIVIIINMLFLLILLAYITRSSGRA